MMSRMKRFPIPSKLKDQQGTTAIIVGLVIFMLLGFAALAVDLTHLYVVKNELQNAADAGALAGAHDLYFNDGLAVNPGANQTAYDTATANRSETVAVEVNWTGGNTGDVQRGHWRFANKTFYPNASLLPTDLWDVSEEELDADLNFINAVRCVTRREFNPPVASFFARIFGFQLFQLSASAVAYIGFSGTQYPENVDEPIAICEESIVEYNENGEREFNCKVGRWISSGQNVAEHETAGWTDFNQENSPCNGGTNAQAVSSLVCGDGNPEPIHLGSIATNGGQIASAFKDLRDCWETTTNKIKPWELNLVVVKCPGNNITTCQEVTGTVTVHVLWMTGNGEDPSYNNAPTQMAGIPGYAAWPTATDLALPNFATDGQVRWNSFANHFNLTNTDGEQAPYDKMSMYFLPNCETHELTGNTGGTNYGILAKIPVLVR